MLTREKMDLRRMKAITEAGGLSGNEKKVTRLMKEALREAADDFDYDNLGSLICHKQGNGEGPRVMLSSHTDEIGFLVKKIDKRGFLRIISLNRWWTYTLIGQEVWVETSEGKTFPGVFGTKFPNEDINRPVYREIKELYVDLGIRDRQQVLDLGIRPGDTIYMRSEFREMADPDVMMAKAWDDRVGVNILIDVLKQLQGEQIASDLYVCGTVQEEVGYRGGKTCSYKVKPEISITVDVADCDDYPGCDEDGHKLAGGVVIRHYDSKVIGNRALSEFIQATARDLGYAADIIVQDIGGGEAHEIHRQFDGVVTICLSIPSLYILTPRALVHKSRYIATVNTLAEVLRRLGKADLTRFIERQQ